ncbi:MAG TPA: aspartate aminotransferase family protein, partial [Bacteroidetes bacterium]|nr:aspartate aminotransferase family protein [Bacteroidota bacterium]
NSMLDQGVHLPPSGYEAWFVSAAHNEDVIEQTISATYNALRSI